MKRLLKLVVCMGLSITLFAGNLCAINAKETATATTQAVSTTAKKKVIVIDPGHQAKANLKKEAIGPGAKQKKVKVTGGARGDYSKKSESSINLAVAKKLKKELEARGYQVYMTRTSQNVNISNKQRAQIGNKYQADAIIHIHCDDASNHSARGAHTIAPKTNNKYVSKSVRTKSQKLAKTMIKSFCKKTGAKNRGVSYRNDLTNINWSKVPVIFIEMGFLSNKKEDKKLASSSYQTKCAKGIADGFDAYFKKK